MGGAGEIQQKRRKRKDLMGKDNHAVMAGVGSVGALGESTPEVSGDGDLTAR